MPLCLIRDFGIDGDHIGDWYALKVVSAIREAHFGFVQDECEAAILSYPLAGGEAARDLGKLDDEDLDLCWRWLTNNLLEVIVSKIDPHHIGNSRAWCHDQHCLELENAS